MNKIKEVLNKYVKPITGLPNKLIIILLLVIVIIFSLKSCQSDTDIRQLKELIIKQDSLRKVEDGHYQKIVNDLNNSKELFKQLKENNKELAETIKEQKKNPIVVTNTVIKIQPAPLPEPVPIKPDNTFELNYPNKDNKFISFLGIIENDSINGVWDFDEFKLDLVISEKQKGVFEIDAFTNDFIEIKSLTVNSLPLKGIKPDNFDFKVGLGLYTDINTGLGVDIYGGIRIKKFDVVGRIQPNGKNTQLGGGLMFNF